MSQHPDDLDWTYIRSFLAVAETGSLTAAAKRLGQSQPTLGRHIKSVESDLGLELFKRVPDGFQLTEAGLALLEPARNMARASAQLANLASGQDSQLSGTVRITASIVVSHYLLPDILAQIMLSEPDIEIELVPSDTTESLVYREADIAIRMYRPTQLDVITRKIAEQPIAMYASKDLLERLGQPESFDDFATFPFVGFDRTETIIHTMRDLGIEVDRHFFSIRCDEQAAYWELVRAGCGIGAMQTVIGDADPRVEKLTLQPDLPSLPVWLASNETSYRTRRVKRIWDLLSEHLKSRLG